MLLEETKRVFGPDDIAPLGLTQLARNSAPAGLSRSLAAYLFLVLHDWRDNNRLEKRWCPGAGSNHRHCDFQSRLPQLLDLAEAKKLLQFNVAPPTSFATSFMK